MIWMKRDASQEQELEDFGSFSRCVYLKWEWKRK